MKQFAPITQIANVENVLVVSGKSQIRSLAELIALGRSGTQPHLRDTGRGHRSRISPPNCSPTPQASA